MEWDYFLSLITPLASKVPTSADIGNHERDYEHSGLVYITPDSSRECRVGCETYFPMAAIAKDKPWYLTDNANVHFTMISTEHDLKENSEQYAWIKKDLRKVTWRSYKRKRSSHMFGTSLQGMVCLRRDPDNT